MKNRLTQQRQTADSGKIKNIVVILLFAMMLLPVIQLIVTDRGYTYVQAKEQGSGNANTEEGTEPTKTEREEASRNSTQDKGTDSTKKDTTQTENKLVETSVAESGVLSSKTVDVETAETAGTATTSGTETGGTLNVKITLTTDQEWVHTSVDIKVKIKNLDKKKKLKIKSVQAKIGQNGSWSDITDLMQLTISENCTVYVIVKDEDGNTCEKNRYIECFDKDAPVLNAAVNDGLLSVQCQDTQSGVKAAYVNGYEFTKLTDGTLNIRLQKFDAGYQYFTIQAMDRAGNMSEVYKMPNPYYTDPETEGKAAGASDPKEQLPTNAKATEPTQAKAEVTEHTKTDSAGNVLQTQYGTGTIQKGADVGSGTESKSGTASGTKTDTKGGTVSGATDSGATADVNGGTNTGAGTISGAKADVKGGTESVA